MRIRDVLEDLINLFALIGLLYAAFMISVGMGWI